MSNADRYNRGEKEIFSKGGYTLTWNFFCEYDGSDAIRLWRDGESQPFKIFPDIDLARDFLFALLREEERQQQASPEADKQRAPEPAPAPQPVLQQAATPRKLETALPGSVSFRLLASLDDPVALDNTRAWLHVLARLNPGQVVFSLVGDGNAGEIYPALTVPAGLAEKLEDELLTSFYPHLQLEPATLPADFQVAVDYCAEHPNGILRTFTDFNPDPLALFCSTLQGLNAGELAMVRIEFAVAPPDSELQIRAHHYSSTSLPYPRDLSDADWNKKRQPPRWVVEIKLLASAGSSARSQEILHALEQHLGEFHRHPTGKLVRYSPQHHQTLAHTCFVAFWSGYQNSSYPPPDFNKASEEFYEKFPDAYPKALWNKTFLTTDELAGFVHLPHKSIACPILQRANMQAKKAPDELTTPEGLLLGTNEWRRQSKEVRLPHHLRSRHTYIVGASGSGKSNLLKNCIRQDIEEGRGLAVIDPHGDLVADVLPFIPEHRAGDVILFNPSDRDFPVSINPFVPTTDDNRNDVALTFKTTFIRLFNVGDEAKRMLHLLHITTLALLEAGGKTFLDIRRFLINPDFRNQVLESINDPTVLEFWYEEFPRDYPKGATAPINTRLTQFALSPVTRNILGQKQQAFDLYEVMNGGKILLCPLGKIQEEERQLLGSLLVSQLQLATMRRAEQVEAERRPFLLYIDEFQNFANDAVSLEKILSEARKYNLGLILAHQFTSQLPAALIDAIMGNAYTKIIFRVGVDDARYLEKALSGYTAQDLQNQAIGQAVMSAGRAQDSFNLKTFKFSDPPANHQANAIIQHSRKTYGKPRVEVERELRPAAPPPQQLAAAAPQSPQQSETPAAESPSVLDDIFGNQ